MPYVYILSCSDGTYYTGATKNIEKRLSAHQKGKAAKYTRGRLPVKIVFSEYYKTLSEAMKKEKEIQKLSRTHKINIIKAKFNKKMNL